MKHLFIFCLVCSLVWSCSSDVSQYKAAVNIAASVWGAKGEFTGVKHVDKSQGEHVHHLGLSCSEFTKAPENYSDETLSSILALAFAQNVDPQYLVDYEGIEVEIIREGRQSRYLYSFKDLKDVAGLSELVANFLNASYANEIESLKKFVDEESFPDTLLAQYRDQKILEDTMHGQVMMNMIGGFRYAELGESGEPVILFLASQQRSDSPSEFIVFVSRKSAKIIGIQNGNNTFIK